MKLKTNLLRHLARVGWNVAQLARRSSVPRSTIAEWLNGSKSVKNADNLKKVADALSITVDELLFGDGKVDPDTDGILDSLTDGADGWLTGAFEVKLRPLKRGRRD